MTSTHSFLSSLFVAALLSAGVWLSGCDYSDETTADNIGQVSVTGNEGLLVGEGAMLVQGHHIVVRMGRVNVDGQDFGGVPAGAEVYFRSNGNYRQLRVNGEDKSPTKKP